MSLKDGQKLMKGIKEFCEDKSKHNTPFRYKTKEGMTFQLSKDENFSLCIQSGALYACYIFDRLNHINIEKYGRLPDGSTHRLVIYFDNKFHKMQGFRRAGRMFIWLGQ